jgi:hypothetical protein
MDSRVQHAERKVVVGGEHDQGAVREGARIQPREQPVLGVANRDYEHVYEDL